MSTTRRLARGSSRASCRDVAVEAGIGGSQDAATQDDGDLVVSEVEPGEGRSGHDGHLVGLPAADAESSDVAGRSCREDVAREVGEVHEIDAPVVERHADVSDALRTGALQDGLAEQRSAGRARPRAEQRPRWRPPPGRCHRPSRRRCVRAPGSGRARRRPVRPPR